MKLSSLQRPFRLFISLACLLCMLAGCTYPTTVPASELDESWAAPTQSGILEEGSKEGILADHEIATLSSLEKVDDYPLYTMHSSGSYTLPPISQVVRRWALQESAGDDRRTIPSPWACSLFAALGDTENMYFGRNFDWEYSPALLLFTDPPDGYASVSMVDLEYLGFVGSRVDTLTDLPLVERRALLNAPFWPFDGMNEHGLVVGMAAVPSGDMIPDPGKRTLTSIQVIRMILDRAANVQEAIEIFQSYNVVWGGSPPLHYLIADSQGQAALVEFYQGEMVVILNQVPWHQATNFLRSSVGESTEGVCWRYDRVQQRLTEAEGRLDSTEALELLGDVSQRETQWSVVYGIQSGGISVVMGQAFDRVHSFHLMILND